MRKNQFITGVAILLLVSMAVLWSNYSEQDALQQANNTESSGFQWHVGASQQYQVRTDSILVLKMGNSDPQSMRVEMAALLDTMTLATDKESSVVGMQLSSIDFRLGGKPDQETIQSLAVPFRVRFVSGGVPEAFEFPPTVTAENRSILQNLVQMFQVTMRTGKTWTAQESNASGRFESMYQRLGPSRIEKNKKHFVQAPSTPMLNGAQINSTEALRIDKQHDWLAEMTINENIVTRGETGMQISNHATLALTSASTSQQTSNWGFIATATPAPAQASSTKSAVPAISAEKALQQIHSAIQQLDTTQQGRITWIHRLRDLLRVDSSLPDALLEELKKGQVSDQTQADLYLALELADTEASQTALVSVMQGDNWSTRNALRAIVALSGIDEPTPQTRAALWEMVEQADIEKGRQTLVSAAMYALGSLGKAMKQRDDPEYIDIRERLLQGALSNTGGENIAERRSDFVLAIGNTRDATLAGSIVGLLDDQAPAVRRATAQSLAMLDTGQSADKLMTRLSQESNNAVRAAIAKSLVTWEAPTPEAVSSIRDNVQLEPDENTRYHMARFLGKHLDKNPESRQVLQTMLKNEPSKRIRQQIANALAAHSKEQ